jgi:2-methylisocitrate lyase-like PEP mutase family enzyme
MSNAGATANVAGYPDIGLITLTEMARTIREISDASGIPVIADADTGYGGLLNVRRTVRGYEKAGVAAIFGPGTNIPAAASQILGLIGSRSQAA